MRKLVYTMFINNNRTPFHLWWKENLLKNQNVSKMIVGWTEVKSSPISPLGHAPDFIVKIVNGFQPLTVSDNRFSNNIINAVSGKISPIICKKSHGEIPFYKKIPSEKINWGKNPVGNNLPGRNPMILNFFCSVLVTFWVAFSFIWW